MHLKHYLCSEQLSAAGISSVLITTAQREVSVRFRKEREALHLITALPFDKSVAPLPWVHGRQHSTELLGLLPLTHTSLLRDNLR